MYFGRVDEVSKDERRERTSTTGTRKWGGGTCMKDTTMHNLLLLTKR